MIGIDFNEDSQIMLLNLEQLVISLDINDFMSTPKPSVNVPSPSKDLEDWDMWLKSKYPVFLCLHGFLLMIFNSLKY